MSVAAQTQAAAWRLRRRNRSKQFAAALTVHQAGLTVIGMDRVATAAAADFVQSEIDGLPWIALTSGVSSGAPLSGNGTMSDGTITWMQWGGYISASPNTPGG